MARTCKWGVVKVVGGDLWEHEGDVLITPANNRLSGREGLDATVHAKAGEELTQVTRNICLEMRKINAPPCAVTNNVVTEPFALKDKFKYILSDGSFLGIKITYEVQEKPEGIAQAFLIGETFLDGHPSITVSYTHLTLPTSDLV